MQTVNKALKLEVMERNASAAVAFFVIAAICGYNKLFLPQHSSFVSLMCLLIMSISASRTLLFYRWKHQKVATDDVWNVLRWLIWGNSGLWAVLLTFGSYHSWYPSPTFALVMMAVMTFTTASVFTLSPFASLHLPLILTIMIPQAGFALYYYWKSGLQTDIMFFACIVILMFYVLRQAAIHRERLKAKISADLELLRGQAELIENQKQLLMQKAMTEHANRLASLGEMAASFAHEINNPLAIIHMSVSLVKKSLLPEQGESHRHLEQSLHAVTRITKTVQGLRKLSRADAGEELELHDLEKLVIEVIALCHEKLNSHAIDLKSHFTPGLVVPCRQIQIGQILINLLNNACDAVEQHDVAGERSISIETGVEQGMAYVRMSNSGTPLSPELHEKIFIPFFTTKEIGKGTGLGLPISRSMAQAHGGDLLLDKDADRPTFILRLPL